MKNPQKNNKNKNRITRSKGKPMTRTDSTKNQRRDREVVDTVANMSTHKKSERNPFSWYNKYPEYTDYAGTLPFGTPLGQTLNLATDTSKALNLNQPIPGICTLEFYPTIGYSSNRNSPINRSAIRWYSALRKLQKASGDYDSQDAMMAYVAVDSLAMFHEIGKRIIGIANNNSVLNRYVPEGLLAAQYVDPIDVRNNIADWIGYVNKFAIDANNVTMPKDISLRDRHSWMCSGLYTDGQTERSQIYMFVPLGFWQYNNTVTTGSQLDFISWATADSPMTLEKYKTMGNALLNAVFGDEDMGLISGDTLNAIGSANCVWFDQIDRSYTLDALYSEMVLSQIENASFIGAWATGYTPVITQDPSVNAGAILFQPKLSVVTSRYNEAYNRLNLLNFHGSKPTVEDTIEATRLCVKGELDEDGNVSPTAFGSELPVQMRVWISNAPTNPQSFVPISQMGSVMVVTQNDVSYASAVTFVAAISQFDWHPMIYIFTEDAAEGSQLVYRGVLADLDVTAVLTEQKLADMHEAAITSLFSIPESFIR